MVPSMVWYSLFIYYKLEGSARQGQKQIQVNSLKKIVFINNFF